MSMHLRNSRDMMTTEEAGWWVSKTPLEQKLVILSSVLFILSFCLTISVIVLDNRKPPPCGGSTTTVAPGNATDPETSPTDTTPTSPEISTDATTTVNTKSSEESKGNAVELTTPLASTENPPEHDSSPRQA